MKVGEPIEWRVERNVGNDVWVNFRTHVGRSVRSRMLDIVDSVGRADIVVAFVIRAIREGR